MEELKEIIKIIGNKKVLSKKGKGIAGSIYLDEDDGYHFLKLLQLIKSSKDFNEIYFVLDKELEMFQIIASNPPDTFMKIIFNKGFISISPDYTLIIELLKNDIDQILKNVLDKKKASVTKEDNPALEIIFSDTELVIKNLTKDITNNFTFTVSYQDQFKSIINQLLSIGKMEISYSNYLSSFYDLGEVSNFFKLEYNKDKEKLFLKEVGQEGDTIISIPYDLFSLIKIDRDIIIKSFRTASLKYLSKFKPYLKEDTLINIFIYDPIDTYLKVESNLEKIDAKIELYINDNIYSYDEWDDEDDDSLTISEDGNPSHIHI